MRAVSAPPKPATVLDIMPLYNYNLNTLCYLHNYICVCFQVLESTCDVDITYFPFDTQECDLKLMAWSYSKDDVNINVGSSGIQLVEYSSNSVWDVVSTSSSETNSFEASVTFSLKLKRKPIFYVINIIIPVVLLSVLNVCTFALPVSSGERASYSVTVFLSLAVFLTIVASELPKNSDVVSIISVYLTAMSVMSTLIVVICVIELRLAPRTVEEYPINKFYRTIHTIHEILTFKRKRKDKVKPAKDSHVNLKKNNSNNPEETANGQGHLDPTDNTKRHKLTWIKVISAMDFLLFWIFFVFTIVITVVIFIICSNHG